MSSVQTVVAQRKNRKLLVVNASGSAGRLYTTAQLYAALNVASGLSSPVQFVGGASVASNGVITENNLGSVVVYATDADLGLFITKATTGLSDLITSGSVIPSVGETLRDMGRKLRVGTTTNSNLVTFTQVQRTDQGLTTTGGVAQGAATITDQQLLYGVYWVVTESFADLNSSSVFYLSAASKVLVGVVPTA